MKRAILDIGKEYFNSYLQDDTKNEITQASTRESVDSILNGKKTSLINTIGNSDTITLEEAFFLMKNKSFIERNGITLSGLHKDVANSHMLKMEKDSEIYMLDLGILDGYKGQITIDDVHILESFFEYSDTCSSTNFDIIINNFGITGISELYNVKPLLSSDALLPLIIKDFPHTEPHILSLLSEVLYDMDEDFLTHLISITNFQSIQELLEDTLLFDNQDVEWDIGSGDIHSNLHDFSIEKLKILKEHFNIDSDNLLSILGLENDTDQSALHISVINHSPLNVLRYYAKSNNLTNTFAELHTFLITCNVNSLTILLEHNIQTSEKHGELHKVLLETSSISVKSAIENGISQIDDLVLVEDILNTKNKNLDLLFTHGINKVSDLLLLQDVINNVAGEQLQLLLEHGIIVPGDLVLFKDIMIDYTNSHLKILLASGIDSHEDLTRLKETIATIKIENLELVLSMNINNATDILSLKNILTYAKSDELKTVLDLGYTDIKSLLALEKFFIYRAIDLSHGLSFLENRQYIDFLMTLKGSMKKAQLFNYVDSDNSNLVAYVLENEIKSIFKLLESLKILHTFNLSFKDYFGNIPFNINFSQEYQKSKEKLERDIKRQITDDFSEIDGIEDLSIKDIGESFWYSYKMLKGIQQGGDTIGNEAQAYELCHNALLSNTYNNEGHIYSHYPYNRAENILWKKRHLEESATLWLSRNEKVYDISTSSLKSNHVLSINNYITVANERLGELGVKPLNPSKDFHTILGELESILKTLTSEGGISKSSPIYADLKSETDKIRTKLNQAHGGKEPLNQISISHELDPLESASMGKYVDGSCLSFDSESKNYWLSFTNALEINKGVFYIRNNQTHQIIARVLVGLTDNNKLMRFQTYYKNTGLDLEEYIEQYIETLSQELGRERTKDNDERDNVKLLFCQGWYRDPVV